jgi:hypothetical protein
MINLLYWTGLILAGTVIAFLGLEALIEIYIWMKV